MSDTLAAALLGLVKSRLVTEYPGQLTRCLQVLDDEDIWWRPNEQANAVGNLVLHLSGSNRHYIEHVVGGDSYARDREAEFLARGARTKADLVAVWADVTRRVARVLDQLTEARLDEPTSEAGRSVGQILLHVTHHNALHLGQIVWVTKLRKPGALHELTRGPQPPTP